MWAQSLILTRSRLVGLVDSLKSSENIWHTRTQLVIVHIVCKSQTFRLLWLDIDLGGLLCDATNTLNLIQEIIEG